MDVVTNASPFPFCYSWSVCCGPLASPRSALDLSELITVPGQSWAVFAPVPAGELLRSQPPVEAELGRNAWASLHLIMLPRNQESASVLVHLS